MGGGEAVEGERGREGGGGRDSLPLSNVFPRPLNIFGVQSLPDRLA